jgi:hypothetical protein
LREKKSDQLFLRTLVSNREITIQPIEPFFFFHYRDDAWGPEYRSFTVLPEILTNNVTGIVTARDSLSVAIEKSDLYATIESFISTELTDKQLRERYWPGKKEGRYPPGDSRGWKLPDARKALREIDAFENRIINCDYRPFDRRSIFYDPALIDWGRWDMMRHMLGGENVALSTVRQLATSPWEHVLVCTNPQDDCYISNRTKERGYLFPLWLRPSDGENSRRPNVDKRYAKAFCEHVSLAYEDGISRGEQTSMGAKVRYEVSENKSPLDEPWDGRGDLTTTFGPSDLFYWIYAVLHSPGYRSRYSEFLKSDFPRIPIPKNRSIFSALTLFGHELVALHLLKVEDAGVLKNPEYRFVGTKEARVERGFPKFENGKVMINELRWFEDVPKESWEFHVGGYQVLQKWLKDRAAKGGKKPSPGRVLTDEDILHYRRVIVALTETRRVMAEIDRAIEEHGGWPEAFYVPPPPPPTVEEIIQADESSEIEYKSTFQWDVRESKRNKDLQKATLKTLAAFLNSDGGTLVIGVTDGKELFWSGKGSFLHEGNDRSVRKDRSPGIR